MQDIAGALGNISKTPLKEDLGVAGWEEGGGGGQEDTCSGLLQAPSSLPSTSVGRKHLALRTWLPPHSPATCTLASSCHCGATVTETIPTS